MNNLTPPVVCVCLFLILGMLITPRVIYAENPEMAEPLSALQEVEKQINVEEDTEDPLHRWRRLQEERVMREMQETPLSAGSYSSSSDGIDFFSLILGGLLTLGGAYSILRTTHHLNEKASRKIEQRKKIEGLVQSAYHIMHEIDKTRQRINDGSIISDQDDDHLAHIVALSKLYLPELAKEVRALELAASDYAVWAARWAHQRSAEENIDELKSSYPDIDKNLRLALVTIIEKSALKAGKF